jgi:GWxTD domain-containing protein
MKKSMKITISTFFILLILFSVDVKAQKILKFACDNQQPKTEREFKIWLKEDVGYIITKAETEDFLKLQTIEDQNKFIENFWFRRDPDSDTKANEFRDEYCKRANNTSQFDSGILGWRTDRGRTYIIWGEPSRIIKGYSTYEEFTSVLFEKWIYEQIDGTADIVEVTFVDPLGTDEFRFLKTEKGKFLMTFTIYNNWILSKLDSQRKSKNEK